MHVLITADTLGGVWTYARELVSGLVKRGVRVTLVSFGEIPAPAQAEWLDGLGVDFRPTAFRLEWMQECAGDLAASSEFLAAVVQEVRPDVLHLNQYAYGALEAGVPRLVVAHSDVVSWWVEVHGEPPPESPWVRGYREIVHRGLAGATAVVAPSRWMLEAISTHYFAPAHGRVIYNGRTPTLFNPYVSKDEYVLSVGRLWDGGKQTALLTRAEVPAPIFIAGTEEHPDEIFRTKSMLTGRSRLHLKGPQSEVQLRQLYSRAAIYAATSRYEPFGLAPLEAALSRCALVVNDIPSLREIWGEAACYFPRHDAAGLGRVLSRLHADTELRQTYAAFAYQHAVRNYTADRMVEDYLALYRALVAAEVAAA